MLVMICKNAFSYIHHYNMVNLTIIQKNKQYFLFYTFKFMNNIKCGIFVNAESIAGTIFNIIQFDINNSLNRIRLKIL